MRKQSLVPAIAAALTMLAAPASHAAYSNAVIALNPVAYWPLSETTQPPAGLISVTGTNYGSLGDSLNSTFIGDTVFGYPGALASGTDTADSFNEQAQSAAPASPLVSVTPPFTIEAWIQMHDDGTYWGTCGVLSDMDAVSSDYSGWTLYIDEDNIGQFTFVTHAQNGTTPSLKLDLSTPGSIQEQQWNHVAIVVTPEGGVTNVYAYINGTQVNGPVVLTNFVPNDGLNGGFTMGDRSDNTGWNCDGALDEVAFYTSALSAATILAHYQAGTNSSPATPYPNLIQQSSPALYYRMNEVPNTQFGPYPQAWPVAANLGSLGALANGWYQPGTTPGLPGPTNAGFGPVSRATGFSTDGLPSTTTAGPAVLCAPFDETALASSDGMTLAAWVQVPLGLVSWFQTVVGRSDGSYRFDVDTSGNPHFAANPNGDIIGQVALNDGLWHFWVGVYDPVAKQLDLYIDGLLAAHEGASPLGNLTTYLLIGGAPDYHNRNFVGSVAHVAVWTNALSVSQIQGLYSSAGGVPPGVQLSTYAFTLDDGANGTLTASVVGSSPLGIQWYEVTTSNETNALPGQTSDTLAFTDVQAAQNGYMYFVVATNAYGTASSPPATLTVVAGPPQIQVDVTPASQQVPVGVPITYSVQVTGTLPFSYQWYLNGTTLIPGATNASYTVIAPTGTTTYSVTIKNSVGQTPSSTATLIGVTTPPPVTTFNTSGTDWTLNGNVATAGFSNNVLTLTDNTGGEAESAFYNTPQYIGGFVAFFTYQMSATAGATPADGTTFCIQDSPAGTSALGGGGGDLAYYGITNSAALELNLYTGAHGGSGFQFGTNGMTPDSAVPTSPYMPVSPVNLNSGDPINVWLYCLAGTAYVLLTDTTTSASFSTTLNVGSLRDAIGADTAYIGFTGATGGDEASQMVSNFRFSYTTAATLSAAKNGTNLVVSWPVSVATFFKLQQSSAVTGPYTNVVTQPVVSGLQNQVTVPATGAGQFYRLNLQ
ncbi:MAG: LamG-like jellyroll fold domain-containing protein [Limisphaerales bacterium]